MRSADEKFQSPEGEVLTVQQQHPDCGAAKLHSVSVPRRGSADGATLCHTKASEYGALFQSPEGEVLTVQRECERELGQPTQSFSPPKGKC